MDARLERAVLELLERAETGADVSERWLREHHPRDWRELAAYLELQDRLREGRPARDRVGPYRIRRRLGQGGMGTVHLGVVEDAGAGVPVGTTVALKLVHPHLLHRDGFVQRALREARLGKSVRHPNVARTLDVGLSAHDGREDLYLVAEYVEGQNLRGLLDELVTVPEDLCRHVGREVLRALAAIHAAGAVHRDLKPENVIVTPEGVVKVMDLGAARPPVEREPSGEDDEFHGTFLYAAPEQLASPSRAVDGRADLFALGVILHELATGAHPFGASGAARLARGRPLPAPPPRADAGVSAFFDEFVGVLLAQHPDDRFASARHALDVLEDGETSAWWHRRARRRAAPRASHRRPRWPDVTPLVGREEDLAALRQAFDDAVAGRGRAVVLEGEAGIGKSRLVWELADHLEDAGVAVRLLVAPHAPGVSGEPGQAFASALAETLGPGDLAAALTPRLGELAPYADDVASLLRGEAEKERAASLLPDALVRILRSLAAETPVVAFVDDLHFASAETRALFLHLAAATAGARVLLVGALRTGSADRWLDDAESAGHAVRRRLGRLPESELRRLLDAALASPAAAARAMPLVASRSDGNPYFALALLASLRETGRLVPAADGSFVLADDAGDAQIPPTVRDLVRARLDELGQEDREILDAAACCGFEFDPLLVAAALRREPLPVLRRLVQIERRNRIVRAAGAVYAFDHHVVQEALVERMPAAVASVHHERIGAALEAQSGAAGGVRTPAMGYRLANHFLRAGRGGRATPYLAGALRHVDAGFRAASALEFAERALAPEARLPAAERRTALLAKASYLFRLGRPDEQVDALRAARDEALTAGDGMHVTETRGALAHGLMRAGRVHDAVAEARTSLEEAVASADARRIEEAHGMLGVVLGMVGRVREAREHLEETLRLAMASSDARRQAEALASLSVGLMKEGRCEESLAHLRRAVAVIATVDVPPGLVRNLRSNLASSLLAMGRHDEAVALFEDLAVLARDSGDRVLEAFAMTEIATAVGQTRSIAEGLAYQERALDAAVTSRFPLIAALARYRVASGLYQTGVWERALEECERSLEECRAAQIPQGESAGQVLRANLLAVLGDTAGGRASAEKALALARTSKLRREEVLALVATAAASEPEEACRALLAAAAVCRELGDLALLTRPMVGLGRAHLAAGRPDAAGAALEEGLALATARGITPLAVIAAVHLARLGRHDATEAAALLDAHAGSVTVEDRMACELALHRVDGDARRLATARELLAAVVENAPLRYRESMVTRVALHAAVRAASGEAPEVGAPRRRGAARAP